MGRRAASVSSHFTVSDSESSASLDSPRPAKKPRTSLKNTVKSRGAIPDLEDAGDIIVRSHGRDYHSTRDVVPLQQDVLNWFEGVREKRGMPWRKRYDATLTPAEKGQRAYEIWVSEVMLQQTQVSTVIDYWKRWMERWPTINDLAKADVEEVNAAWRGLGYYRRARSLLKGSQTVMGDTKYNGRLPRDPAILEKEVDGVGRYTAGAITSMAYGVRTPIVDGNIHRLLTRLLAVHAPQADGATIKSLWNAAQELVETLPKEDGIAGDWNQALMELGSQVCKPVGPECTACPLQKGCKALAELSGPPPMVADTCDLCAPIPGSGERLPSVTIFPMKKDKKVSREENEVVCITEWTDGTNRRWLFTKRPETGLLAGLFEPPTMPVDAESTEETRLSIALAKVAMLLNTSSSSISSMITSTQHFDPVPHIFSHINMTYHVIRIVISVSSIPDLASGVWLDSANVERANIGTGVKKVWKAVYGSWGNFDASRGIAKKKTTKNAKQRSKAAPSPGTKMVKKVMMPVMPVKTTAQKGTA